MAAALPTFEEVIITEAKRIAEQAWLIVLDARANRIERLEGLKILCACKGILLPDIDEKWLTVRQVAQLRRVKQELTEKALRRKERKKKQNRRGYIRRRIAVLEQQEASGTATATVN
jgi:hypothetical protein